MESIDIANIKVPKTITYNDSSLICNGAGIRKKFMIKIYVGALYLKEKQTDAEKIINLAEPMAMRLHILYDKLSSKQMIGAIEEGFQKSVGSGIEKFKKETQLLYEALAQIKKNDYFDMIYIPEDGIDVLKNDTSMGKIDNNYEFKKALFGIWLGQNPVDATLKNKLLGV
ncbi:MAG: chalcone isomerase family protein [Desulfobacterales bacterium]|nr:chalcone isomerase family protein [Desulfobacterales bacterium]